MMLHLLKSYLFLFFKRCGRQATFSILWITFVSCFEGIIAFFLITLFGFLGIKESNGWMGDIPNFLNHTQNLPKDSVFWLVLFGLGLAMVLKGIFVAIQTIQCQKTEEDWKFYLRSTLTQFIFNAPWIRLTNQKSSNFLHALTTEIDRVGESAFFLLSATAQGFEVLVYLLLTWKAARAPEFFWVMLGFGLIFFLFNRRFQQTKDYGADLSKNTANYFKVIKEHLESLKTTKIQGQEEKSVQCLANTSVELKAATLNLVHRMALNKSLFLVTSVFLLGILGWISFKIFEIQSVQFLVVLFLMYRALPKAMALKEDLQEFVYRLASFENVQGQIENLSKNLPTTNFSASQKITFNHQIVLDRISFSYADNKSCVTSDATIHINSKCVTALLGPSGSGKTTLIDILSGLLSPDKGRVLIDGKVLNSNNLKSWQNQIAYVSQDLFLFNDTLKANLLWANPLASTDQIWRALKLAACQDFVLSLPDGLNTLVGDRGVCLSMGQRQRVALAAAILRNPTLLILDECTAHLDEETQGWIKQTLVQLKETTTVFLVTHHASLAQVADQVYRLDQGVLELSTLDTITY